MSPEDMTPDLDLIGRGEIQFYYRESDVALVVAGLLLLAAAIINPGTDWFLSLAGGLINGHGLGNMLRFRRKCRNFIEGRAGLR